MVPTLNDTKTDFADLFGIREATNGKSENVKFNFRNCSFLRPNAVAFLGGLANHIRFHGGSAEFVWNSCHNTAVLTNLCQNGFAGYFDYPSSSWNGNSIPYRQDNSMAMNDIMDYLTYSWVGKGWVNVSEKLRDAIAGRMWEIYNNAFEHSRTQVGVFSCGQHYHQNTELILSVIDFGTGIPLNIKNFFRKFVEEATVRKISDANCLKWAFGRGNSTCSDSIPRGLGLDLLKEFVRINQGKLEIYSNQGYAIIDKDGERFEDFSISFAGTVVHITLRCDEALYKFSFED